MDINNVTRLLKSNKIRERNEALKSLETIASSKFNFGPKPFRSITQAIFDLIENEKVLYHNNKSNPVESRLAKASESLRVLTEKSIDDKKIKITSKTYLEIFSGISENFRTEHEILLPCSIDFSKILVGIIRQDPFKDHLTKDDWVRTYTFLLDQIDFLLDTPETLLNTIKETIFIEIYKSLQFLISCENSISVSYLQLLCDSNYLRLLYILQRTFKSFKKENILIITLSRIINKLIIITSTENILFVNSLVKLGIRFLNSYYQSQWNSLQIQFLTFLNLPAVHKYLSSENHKLNSNSHSDSIFGSPENLCNEESNFEMNNDILLYHVSTLIQNLSQRTTLIEYSFNSDDIGLIIATSSYRKTWFRLNSIFLKSQNFKPWLLNLGLSTLITSYFNLKYQLSLKVPKENLSGSILETPTKKQRLDIITESLYGCNTLLEFCNNLILYKSDNRVQVLGLQLLTFNIEFNLKNDSSINHIFDAADDKNIVSSPETCFNSSEVRNRNKNIDINTIFESILGTFENPTLHYWALVASRSLLFSSLQIGTEISTKIAFPLIKLSLSILNDQNLSNIASNLVYIILTVFSGEKLAKLLDKSLITQIDNLIDLSEINGPFFISNESFQFWYSIYIMISNINMGKRDIIISRIQQWLLFKWDTDFQMDSELLNNKNGLPTFIAWLCGSSVDVVFTGDTWGIYDGPLNQTFYFMKNYSTLADFISLESSYFTYNIKNNFQMESIGENKYQDILLTKVAEHMKVYSGTEDIVLKLKWSILSLSLLYLLKQSPPRNKTVSMLEYQCSAVFSSFKESDFDRDVLVDIVDTLNDVAIETVKVELFIKNFPFTQLYYTIRNALSKNRKNLKLVDPEHMNTDITDTSVIDVEFSAVNYADNPSDNNCTKNSILNPTVLIYEKLNSVDCIKLINFYMPLQSDIESTVQFVIDLMCEMDSWNFLYCLNYLNDCFDSGKINITSTSNLYWKKLIRFLGHGPLIDVELERAELTFAVVSNFSKLLFPTVLRSDDVEFNKDYYDICNWLFECGKRNLILTEGSYVEFCRFLMVLLTSNDERVFENSSIQKLLLIKFEYCTNNTKVQLLDSMCTLMKSSNIEVQMNFYRAIYQKLNNVETSKEKSATYALVLSHLSTTSSHIMLASIFNLLEYSSFQQFLPYLKLALRNICLVSEVSNSSELFKQHRIELLKYWWISYDIRDFPFSVFEYASYEAFLCDNYDELAAIGISINSIINSVKPILTEINSSRALDEASIICDCLRISIPLAFTKDGVRNEVFEKLQLYLGKDYKLELKNRLLITVLSIIQYMDITEDDIYSQNSVLAKRIFIKSSKHSKSYNSISFNSGTSLLNVLICKFYIQPDEFWSLKEVYFLIRQISILIKKSTTNIQKCNLLRKIKFVLIMGQNTYLELKIIKLLIIVACSLLNEIDLKNDIYQIMSVCQFQKLNNSNDINALPLIIKLISLLMSFGLKFKENNSVVSNIENYVNNINSTRKIYPILKASVEILKGGNIKLRSSLFASLLANEDELNYFYKEEHSLITLFSHMFSNVDNFDDVELDAKVVNVLCHIKGVDFKSFSFNFKNWSAKYLSNYYLFKSNNEISEFLCVTEYDNFTSDNFEYSVQFLDEILKCILEVIEGKNFEVAACAESILGVLLWRFKKSKSEILKVFNFETYFDNYEGYIAPIDFHTCVLLNSNNKEVTFFGINLSDFINDISSYIELQFESWTSKLLLAFFQELSKAVNIIPVFSNFVRKVPSFASKVLPFFICYFINFNGESGVDIVVNLINRFIELEISDENFTQLIARIILGLRIGSKKKLAPFQTLTSQLNLEGFISTAAKGNLNKASLMLFEDYYNDSTNSQVLSSNVELLSRIYESIDDDDLIYGLPIDTSLDRTIEALGQSGNGTDTIQLSNGKLDTNLSFGYEKDNSGIFQSLMKDGVMGISRILSKELPNYHNQYSYEWGWKLNCWELPVQREPQNSHSYIYKALKQVHEFPQKGEVLSKELLLDVLYKKDDVFNVSSDSRQLEVNAINWLQTLASISSISNILEYDSSNMMSCINENLRLTSWIECSDPSASEMILLARQATFRVLAESSFKLKDIKSELYWLGALNELIRFNEQSRISNRSQKMVSSAVAINEIAKSKFKDSEFNRSVESISKFYTASTLWKQGQTNFPVAILKSLQDNFSQDLPIRDMNVSTSLIKAKLVNWTADSRQELPSNIMEQYITSALESINEVENLRQRAMVYQIFANFCESQLRSRNFVDQITRLEKCVNAKRVEIDEMKAYYGNISVSNEEKRLVQKYYSKLKSSYLSDISDLESITRKKSEFAHKAVEFYLRGISTNTDSEEELDKFISLWLEFSENDELNAKIEHEILSLPTFKFISWCTQLISRLSKDNSLFQKILRKVIIRLCSEHPFHSVYHLISLRIHDSNASDNAMLKSKYNIANIIWSKLLSSNDEKYKDILMSVEKLCNESIELAAFKVSRNKSLNLEKYDKGSFWLNHVPQIPSPTISLTIDYTKNYKDIPYIISVDKHISIATSGLSLPKVVTFRLSTGFNHKVLLKHGTDDLRQDSIMEQVFEKVNKFFMKDREARKRNLRIRTYKAVPLGPQAGIIEFVPSSVALIDAIKPYHISKDKIKVDKARELMKHYQGKDASDRINAYNQIASKVKPVLRYFFFDNFVTPDIWYNSRQKFARGLATTSMVGHILGLGDRHCNNILLDKISGEPIHIDLGVSFDQGKRLPIPETVPFRLTRDLVDGLGVTGVEGAFKLSCEHTFRVLRENKDHILAILDVLRWDPLYSWSLSPIRKKKLQDEGTEMSKKKVDEDSSEAWNAITSVSDKLIAEGLSVEATVRELIQDATNPTNLALIYFGWCPFF